MKTTIATNERGDVLLKVFDLLTQVKVGNDFYVGQRRYVVRQLTPEGEDRLTIRLEEPYEQQSTLPSL